MYGYLTKLKLHILLIVHFCYMYVFWRKKGVGIFYLFLWTEGFLCRWRLCLHYILYLQFRNARHGTCLLPVNRTQVPRSLAVIPQTPSSLRGPSPDKMAIWGYDWSEPLTWVIISIACKKMTLKFPPPASPHTKMTYKWGKGGKKPERREKSGKKAAEQA